MFGLSASRWPHHHRAYAEFAHRRHKRFRFAMAEIPAVRTLIDTLAARDRSVAERDNRIALLITERGRLFDTLADLRAALETAEGERKAISGHLACLDAEYRDVLGEQIGALCADHAAAIETLTKERDTLRTWNENQMANLGAFVRGIDALTTQRDALEAERDRRVYERDAARRAGEAAESDYLLMMNERDEANAVVERQSGLIAVLASQRDALRDELARWKRPRREDGRFVTGEAVGPDMAERL